MVLCLSLLRWRIANRFVPWPSQGMDLSFQSNVALWAELGSLRLDKINAELALRRVNKKIGAMQVGPASCTHRCFDLFMFVPFC